MSELDANGQVTPQNTENGQTAKPENQPERTFTQSELDEIVKTRLSKEREKYRDYDTLKKKSAEYESLRIEHDETVNKLSSLKEFEDNYKNVYNELEQSLTDTQKALIPQEYSLVKKVDFIKKLQQATASQSDNNTTTPITLPKTDKKVTQVNTQTFGDGKYSSMDEFAIKDPAGFKSWAKKNPYHKQ